jgi:5'-nucleotidase/UDP-sugar diphosphatase
MIVPSHKKGRIQSVLVKKDGNWQAIDPAASYFLVANNYVRGGGDGYRMFGSASDIYDFGPDLADVLASYLAARPDYTPFTDGRIIQK